MGNRPVRRMAPGGGAGWSAVCMTGGTGEGATGGGGVPAGIMPAGGGSLGGGGGALAAGSGSAVESLGAFAAGSGSAVEGLDASRLPHLRACLSSPPSPSLSLAPLGCPHDCWCRSACHSSCSVSPWRPRSDPDAGLPVGGPGGGGGHRSSSLSSLSSCCLVGGRQALVPED